MNASEIDPNGILVEERETYARLLPGLLEHGLAGKWVAIVGDRQVAISDSAETAYGHGLRAAGLERPFLLREVGSDTPVMFPIAVGPG